MRNHGPEPRGGGRRRAKPLLQDLGEEVEGMAVDTQARNHLSPKGLVGFQVLGENGHKMCFSHTSKKIHDLQAKTAKNPTSPLGDRWFRTCVAASIPTSNPSSCTIVLEEGFTPPPTC